MSTAIFAQLSEAAQQLEGDVRENALTLIERMTSTVEGIGDDAKSWRAPTMKVVQATTDRTKLPKGTAIGSLVIGEEVIEQPTKVIPLRIWNSRQYWSPDQNEATMLCQSLDAKVGLKGECKSCPHAVFDEVAKRSDCGKSKTALCITDDFKHIFFINFSKTNYSAGMDFESLMKKAGVNPYRRVYEMKTETGIKFKNVEGLVVTNAGRTPDALIPFLDILFKQVSEDRKQTLERFVEYVRSRAAGGLALAAPADADTKLIEVSAEPAPAEEASGGESKKYMI